MNPKSLSRYHLGLEAESRALQWLQKKLPGFQLIARNFRRKHGELDLIFEIENELVFVEVRVRSQSGWVSGIESITHAKRRRISQTISAYLARYRGNAHTIRFDVMDWNGRVWTHYENVRLF